MIGDRIQERIDALGISQSELARRTQLNPSTINGLVRGNQRSSVHLHRIARGLSTTPQYLEGETDDPDEDAPPPPLPPLHQVLTMQVLLPSEAALAAMYEAQLRVFGDLRGAELAHALAKRLPSALGRLQAAELYEETVDDESRSEEPSSPSQALPEPQRARRR